MKDHICKKPFSVDQSPQLRSIEINKLVINRLAELLKKNVSQTSASSLACKLYFGQLDI